jgi:hypothetical protein
MAEELQSLQTVREDEKIVEGEVVWVLIPRGDGLQKLVFAGLVGSAAQRAQKLPAALEPLLNWFHTTIKSVQQQKLRAVKGVKPTNCGWK